MASASRPEPAARPPGSFRRQATVMVGLLATFAGLFLVAGALPTGPSAYPGTLGDLAAGLTGLFVGALLLGYALGVRGRGARR